ncbi:PAQR family membrane homeostasis protein TrhA [Salinivirga cyanobacteriivorans]|nr:hemolysin III family protein [Salinivirga cyanobacteriivorans]
MPEKTIAGRFSKKEEQANAISHGIGTILAITGLVFMVIVALKYGTVRGIASASVYGTTLVLLYFSSTLNHSLKVGKAKDFFHNFDQVAIYLLIAGTYTPIALVGLHGDWGWTLFGLQWGFAFAGIIVKVFLPNKFEKGVNIFYIISYIIMGWMLLFFLQPIFRNIPTMGVVFLLIGGACYTLGTVFFKMEKLPYHHLIWHLFVITGSVMHALAVLFYVLPA